MTPRPAPVAPLPYDYVELLRQSLAGLAPGDLLTQVFDRLEGRK